ncbi:hypothetical protein LSAT2_008253, partial [Lamellibrachia satsuma]
MDDAYEEETTLYQDTCHRGTSSRQTGDKLQDHLEETHTTAGQLVTTVQDQTTRRDSGAFGDTLTMLTTSILTTCRHTVDS